MNEDYEIDYELKTKHGIDKLRLMLHFLKVIEYSKSLKKMDNNFNKLKSFLVQQIKRGLSKQENINLLKGINNFIISDAGENERLKSLDYLKEAKFLD